MNKVPLELVDDIPDFVLAATSGPDAAVLVLKVELDKLLGPLEVEMTVDEWVNGSGGLAL